MLYSSSGYWNGISCSLNWSQFRESCLLYTSKDDEIKQKQLEEQVKDRYFKVGIAAAELMIPLMFYGIWMNKGFKFEETGTITSSTFKGLINRFKPTKK